MSKSLHQRLCELYPICRSITGDGVRETLARIQEVIPLDLVEVPSGTDVLDWVVPDEWNITEGWIEAPDGKRIVDFADHNLHLVNYSIPVDLELELEDLQPHLHSLPHLPQAIPYKTTYYKDDWGFCLSHQQRESLLPGKYRVCIRGKKGPGHLTYGEYYLPGRSEREILISTHVCHPSLANDNLSGVVIASELAKWLQERPHRNLSVRFLFIPGTIGAITWLALNESQLHKIRYGLVLSGLGDPGNFTYKKTRMGDQRIDRIMIRMMQDLGMEDRVIDFSPYGYDERQFGSPGFNLPIGSFGRTPYSQYPEYHTSLDSPEFVSESALNESLTVLQRVIETIEQEQVSEDGLYWNLVGKGEPQLGKRGLYGPSITASTIAMLWVLNFSDGNWTLNEIAQRSQIALKDLIEASQTLLKNGLLTRDP